MHNNENTYHLWATRKGIPCQRYSRNICETIQDLGKREASTYSSTQTSNSILRLQIKYVMTEGD